MPHPGQTVAEGMHAPAGIRSEFAGCDKDHARGSKRKKGFAVACHAGADRPGGIVAGTRHDRNRLHSPRRGEGLAEMAAGFIAFMERGHLLGAEARRGEHLVAPAPRAGVEPQRARAVGQVGRLLACQNQAKIILGQ